MRDLTNAHVRAVVSTGETWMYDVEQPANALAQHLGLFGPAVGTRRAGFYPVGAESLPVITVHVAQPQWSSGNNATPLNPIGGAGGSR